MLVNKLTDHRAPVAAAALKAATSVMQHVQPSNPAAFINRVLQLHNEQQDPTGPGQDLSALLQLIILVRTQQQPACAAPQSLDKHVNTSCTWCACALEIEMLACS